MKKILTPNKQYSDKMDKDYKKIIAGIHKNLRNKRWNCLFDFCENSSINSHLLQQNGILNTIAENGHLIEVKPVDTFRWTENQLPLEFKKVGIRHAISLDVFCSIHDSELFKPIETSPIDFNEIENQILLSYRVICAEIRKKMINVEIYKRLLNSNVLNYDPQQKRTLNLSILGNERGIADLEIYKNILEKSLSKKEFSSFEFKLFQYPLIKVYCSASFTPYETVYTGVEDTLLNYVFIHIIPYQNNLNIIIGYHKEHVTDYIKKYISSWDSLTMEELENKLTNLFATKIENWGLSPLIHEKISKNTINKLMKYLVENSLNHLQSQEVDFNLFENRNYGT